MSLASMAARIERLPLSTFHRRFVGLIALGGWFDFYDIFMMAYIGAAMQHSGFISRDEFGWVIAAGFLGMFIGTVIFGMGSDRFGRRTAFLWMLLIYSGFTLLGAFAQNAWSLIVLRALAGVGIGAELVVIDTYVTEMVPSGARGRYVAITQVVGFTAIPVVAYLSKQLVPTHWLMDGWRWVMVIGSVGALLVWYLRRNLPESPRWLEVVGRHAEAEQVMRGIEERVVKATGQSLPEPAYLKVETAKAMVWRELWQPLYRGRTLMLMVFHLLQTIGIYGFANWAPTFLLAQGNGLGQSLEYGFWIALVSPVGPLLAVWSTEYFQRRKAIVILALLMAASGMLFPFSQSGAMIVATGALLTIFSYWFSALLHAYQAELFPTRARATGVGFTYSWSRLSAMFSTLIIAVLLNQGVVAVFVFMGAAMVGVALVVGLFGPNTNAVVLEEVSG
ncbi:MAG: MFS transporter [Methylococcaceae bacterium]|nr:MAG: MFS transporter [Methylococcaceae bacterium]